MRQRALLYIKIAAAAIVLVALSFYVYFQSREYLSGPVIEIISPRNGSMVEESFIEIRGRARNISYLSLNDREITTDTEGNFKEALLLAPGLGIITLKARDTFKRERKESLELIYLPRSTSTKETSASEVITH